MASGAFFGETSNSYIQSHINWAEIETDTGGNRSLVRATLFYKRTNSYGGNTQGNGNFSVTIDGNTCYENPYATITNKEWCGIMYHEVWVPHNDDGTKTVYISATGGIPGTSMTATYIGQDCGLDQIPRKSEISLSTSTQDIGKPIVVYTNRKSSSFHHSVGYGFGSLNKAIASGVGDAVEWTLPEELASQIPDHTNGWGTIFLDTYDSNGNHIGTTQTGFTAVIPESAVPKYKSITIKRIDGAIPSSWGVYVKGKSKIEYTFHNAEGALYSPVREYIVDGAGSSSTNVVTSDFLTKAGNNEFRAYVKDSRGRTSAVQKNTIPVLDYSIPFLSGFTALRCDANGNPMEEGSSMKLSCAFDMAPVGNHNAINGVFYYRKKGQTAWGQAGTFQKNANSPAGSLYTSTVIISNISLDYSYECRVVITDSLGESAEKTFLVQTPEVTIDFKKGGHGIGIGKVAEKENAIEIVDSWEFYYKGKTLVDLVYPVGAIFLSTVNTNPATYLGGTWARWGAGRVPVSVDTTQSEFNAVEKTGGEKTHQLYVNEMPSHNHDNGPNNDGRVIPYHSQLSDAGNTFTLNLSSSQSGNRGGDQPHNNLQPYITCYMWKRTK